MSCQLHAIVCTEDKQTNKLLSVGRSHDSQLASSAPDLGSVMLGSHESGCKFAFSCLPHEGKAQYFTNLGIQIPKYIRHRVSDVTYPIPKPVVIVKHKVAMMRTAAANFIVSLLGKN